MDSSILTISALGMTGLCLSLILRQYNKELCILTAAVTSLFLFSYTITYIRSFFALIQSYLNQIQNGGLYLSVLCKVLITAYMADFTAQLCKDAGENSIAGKVELAGKVTICIVAAPIIISVLELMSKWIIA